MAVDAMQPGALVQRWQVVMFDPFSTLLHFVHILLRHNSAQLPIFEVRASARSRAIRAPFSRLSRWGVCAA
jgi:hypothetical protein